ncbi:hypothetical protein [Umezawaea sp. Da 62-37]|uniref:hypothetical protein n=1 Tax=Umezawaea sp. Da 62-37 TaxID=3075927 RepID=UPI0028F74444|nr:hypothetical protein [Umezawaea sp. Da 62-37]WNV83018.1 hypothetical protein RM788_33155 [Umezawaea sp. Da 62-37]
MSAVVFGEDCGFAVWLLPQSVTGSLFGFPMGSEVADTGSTGYTFTALAPGTPIPTDTPLRSRTINPDAAEVLILVVRERPDRSRIPHRLHGRAAHIGDRFVVQPARGSLTTDR